MNKEVLRQFLEKEHIPFEVDVSLKEKTWIGFGAAVSFWIVPVSRDELIRAVYFLNSNQMPFDVVGATSNCLFSEEKNYFCIISTSRVRGIVFDEESRVITCGCGESLTRLVKRSVAKGAGGLAGLVGIPGTVGAAAVNNAGAFNDLISRLVLRVEISMPDGDVRWISCEEMGYRPRSSVIKRGELSAVVLAVELRWIDADVEMEGQRMTKAIAERIRTQEMKLKNLGSVFATGKGLYKEIAEMHRMYGAVMRLAGFGLSMVLRVFPRFPAIRLLNRITLSFFHKKFAYPVISDCGLNCFVRCPGSTEKDFFDYVDWIFGLTNGRLALEVEVKKSHEGE